MAHHPLGGEGAAGLVAVEAVHGREWAAHLAVDGAVGMPQVGSWATMPGSTCAGMRPPVFSFGTGNMLCGSMVPMPVWERRPPWVR